MAVVTREGKGSALTHIELDNNFNELENSPEGKVFPKTTGIGIKVDVDAPTFPWQDIEGVILTSEGSASMQPYIGGMNQPQFIEGEDAYVSFHIPHDYLEGSELYIHVHWSHNSAVVTGGSVTWAFETIYAKGHNQEPFKTPINISIIDNANIVKYQHQIAENISTSAGGSAVTLATEDIEVDGVIICRIYLDSNDIETSNASIVNPFAHFADIHYQSTGIGTKNKAPNFYS